MTLSPRSKRLVLSLAAALLCMLLASLVVSRLFSSRIASLKKEEEPLLKGLERNRTGRITVEKALADYQSYEKQMLETLQTLKKQLEFPFPAWTVPNPDANPGEYFRRLHAKMRDDLRAVCMKEDVALFDSNLGFEPEGAIRKEKALEDLRKLAIVEKLVNLLAGAKVAVIVNVRPLDPVLTGAHKVIPNPEYRPGLKAPKTLRRDYPAFIKEYPVSIELAAGVDPLMEFLNNIRQEKQFLLVRDISVSSELKTGPKELKEHFKDGMLHVTISAAGMAFLSKEELEGLRTVARAEEDRLRWRYEPLPKDVRPGGY